MFAVAVDPLAIALHGLSTVKGIQRGGIENKNFLYANDMLLYVSEPITSLPKILKMLTEFGGISRYKVNLNKSELMSVIPAATKITLLLCLKQDLECWDHLPLSLGGRINVIKMKCN